MAADLTVDNLCDALRFFFRQIVDTPTQPVDPEKGIVLYGTPADDTMKAMMEAFGGCIRITIREMPEAISFARGAGAGEQGSSPLNLWHPNEGRDVPFREPVGPPPLQSGGR